MVKQDMLSSDNATEELCARVGLPGEAITPLQFFYEFDVPIAAYLWLPLAVKILMGAFCTGSEGYRGAQSGSEWTCRTGSIPTAVYACCAFFRNCCTSGTA